VTRSRSLLEFAVTASAAVLPVMLAVLLLVAVIRPADEAGGLLGSGPADRYVSVRHLAALKTFETAVVLRSPASGAPVAADALAAALPACQRQGQAQEIAAQLAAIDAALLRFSTRANPRVAQPLALDAQRWLAAAQAALATPVEVPQYPGQQFRLGCDDLAQALHALARADGRLLEALAWRGTVSPAALARWAPQQQVEVHARHLMRRNPWNGLAGCIYLGEAHVLAAGHSVQSRLCALPALSGASAVPLALPGEPGGHDAPDDPRWAVPPSLAAMLRPLETLRQPTGGLYRLYTEIDAAEAGGARHGPNRIALPSSGAPVDIGFSVRLTIDPSLQALAQKTAACYTGRHEVCQALGIKRAEDGSKPLGHGLLEGAMVRMAAVAVIDVASGRIEALAGALSPCARQEVDGPGREAHCDRRLPYPVRYRPDALLNPAVYHDAMPASTIKPIMAAAFLGQSPHGRRWLAAETAAMQRGGAPARHSLRGELMRSDSARFLDRMLCIDGGELPCRRPWEVQAAARALGWNIGCDPADGSTTDCGRHDLLFGRAVDARAAGGLVQPLAANVAYGRLLSQPRGAGVGAPMALMPTSAMDPAVLRRCSAGADGARGSDDDWEKCRGRGVVDIVAEGWGQGHARASALGVGGMMATLAAAANGQTAQRRPHLVDRLLDSDARPFEPAVTRWGLDAAQPLAVPRDAAEVILSGLSYSHREGTARSACEQVFDARRCRDIGWLAGKTGTPSFPSDGIGLDELARLCRAAAPGAKGPAKAAAADRSPDRSPDRTTACGALRPYKWYVAAYRADGSAQGPWTKVIAVLAERNWLRRSGIVHGAGDRGPNPAAEIALQIAGRRVGAFAGAAP
jgi:hypothetical protein